MHFRVLVQVDLDEPKVVDGVIFGNYVITLGVNAPSVSVAVRYVEDHLRRLEKGTLITIRELEILALECIDEVPDSVRTSAFRSVSRKGVYWASGRVYGES